LVFFIASFYRPISSNLTVPFEGMLVAEPSEETRALLNEPQSNRETSR